MSAQLPPATSERPSAMKPSAARDTGATSLTNLLKDLTSTTSKVDVVDPECVEKLRTLVPHLLKKLVPEKGMLYIFPEVRNINEQKKHSK